METQQWILEAGLSSYTSRSNDVSGADTADRSHLDRRLTMLNDGIGALDRELQTLVTDREQADLTCVGALTDTGVMGALASFSTTTVDCASLLTKLGQLSAVELLVLARTQPAVFEQLRGAAPADVGTWWSSLDPTAQAALIASVPNIIGNLNGVAYSARDQANRISLDAQLAAAREEYDRLADRKTPMGSAMPVPQDAEARLQALENIKAALRATADGERTLLALTDDIPPLAQIAIGDLDTAQNVSYVVPGMNTYTSDMLGWAKAAQNVYNEQLRVDGSQSYAVVAWIGYETPPIPVIGGLDFGVAAGDYARVGGERLAADLAGFNAATAGNGAILNVISHSYGTTTAANALATDDYGVTNYVMVGSAGIEPSVDGAAGINAENVYAAQADDSLPGQPGDPWAWGGRLMSGRDNPIDPDFGAIVMGADGEPGNSELQPTTAHDVIARSSKDGSYGYLEPRGESLWNVAAATTGHPEKITEDQATVFTLSAPYPRYIG